MRWYTSGHPKKKLRNARKRWNLEGLVEIHHIIPREHKDHPLLHDLNYDVEERYNLILVPNDVGYRLMSLRTSRPVHNRGHYNYNMYVKSCLDTCNTAASLFFLIQMLRMSWRGKKSCEWI